MTIESHVCSLDLARKLRDLGVKQESYFYWFEWATTSIVKDKYYSSQISGEKPYSAFLSSELGEMLPNKIILDEYGELPLGDIKNCVNHWLTNYFNEEEGHVVLQEKADTEANSRAKMLIHLIDQGIVKL